MTANSGRAQRCALVVFHCTWIVCVVQVRISHLPLSVHPLPLFYCCGPGDQRKAAEEQGWHQYWPQCPLLCALRCMLLIAVTIPVTACINQ